MTSTAMEAHVEKMLVLSTAHLSKDTAVALNAWMSRDRDAENPFGTMVVYEKGEYGWLVCADARESSDGPELAEDVRRIAALAESVGASWIMFDRDQDLLDGLPAYDW